MHEKIKTIIDSGLIYEKLEIISDDFNLKLDQLGQLNADLEMFLYGKIESSEVIDVIAKNIEISKDDMEKIWKEIDSKILSEIRTKIRELGDRDYEPVSSVSQAPIQDIESPENVVPPSPIPTPPTPPTPITLEQAGQFTIEPKPTPSTSNLYKDVGLNREDILKSIEDAQIPKPAEPVQESKVNLVDHLLTTPKVNVQKVEQKQVVVDKKPDQAPKSYTIDPYREQI